MSKRARAFAMLGASALCAGLAASSVNDYTNDVRAQVGPLVSVVVAEGEIARGTVVTPAVAATRLRERRVPARFVPPSALRSARDAVSFRALATIRTGDYVSEALLGAGRAESRRHEAFGSGRRLVEVPVAGAGTIGAALHPGTRVDVLITTERAGAAQRTYLALQRIELVDFRGEGASGPGGEQKATATLKVSLAQAVMLTAARNFARELRLVPRASGDDRLLGPTSVTAAGLGR